MQNSSVAILALEDGSIFKGKAFGAPRTIVGEAVFNTSMTGYQEIITDPSYSGQIVTMTTPQIGNYGINEEDNESDSPKLSGLVVRDISPIASNWRSTKTLHEFLLENNIPGITGIDTRAVTKRIRTAGVLKACLSTEGITEEEALQKARDWEGLEGIDLVKEVTCTEVYAFESSWEPFTVAGTNLYPKRPNRPKFNVAAFDFGAKRSIFHKLAYYGFNVTVLPAYTSAKEVFELNPDALFLSNGPGDPSALTSIHETVKELLPHYPTFGICLGHQMITHALGAKTFKLKFGHRGGNQPVKNLETGKVSITAQNHGYASTREELEANNAVVTEINLNDNTIAGLRHKELPVFSVQYHPEAGPGPSDANSLFEDFYQMVAQVKEVPLASPTS